MNRYQHPELINHLASHYVLGTLKPLVRKRMTHILARGSAPQLEAAVLFWESKMSSLNDSVPEIPPKPDTWFAIQKAIQSGNTAPQKKPLSFWEKWLTPGFFQVAAAFSLVIAVFLGWNTLQQTPAAGPLSYVAVMNNDADQPSVVAATYGDSRLLVLDIIDLPPLEEEQSFELWVKSKTDAQFRSLGEIAPNSRNFSRTLTVAEWRLIKDSDILQITVEDLGGSPIGEPMGEIVSEGVCVQLKEWQAT